MTTPAPSFQLLLLVFSVFHLLYLAGLDRPGHLPPYGPQTFPNLFRHRLHIVGLEVARQRRQDGLAGRCRVGIGHCDALRSLPVQNVEDVVVVDGDDPDDAHRHIEVCVGTFHVFLDRSGVHHQKDGQHHRDTEKAPGEAVRAGGVAVAVEFPCDRECTAQSRI